MTPKKPLAKRLLNKLPDSLPAYQYEAFSFKEIQRAITFYQEELAKIHNLLSVVPTLKLDSSPKQPGARVSAMSVDNASASANNPSFYPSRAPAVKDDGGDATSLPTNTPNDSVSPPSPVIPGLETPLFGRMEPKREIHEMG